jgi:hypothetical protein
MKPGRKPKQPVAMVEGHELWLCVKCGEPLPRSRFPAHPHTANRLSPWCKVCHNDKVQAGRLAGRYGNR